MARKQARPIRLVPHLPVTQLGWIGVKVMITLALLFGLIGGLVWLGGRAGQSVSNRSRYSTKVADIRCDPPPGMDRQTFLSEVRYLAQLPETVQSVDANLPGTLSAAFARHPWVESVNGITVSPDGTISAGLTYRQPVLLVRLRDSSARLVDRSGILLPTAPAPTGIATLTGEWAPPTVSPGAIWPDPAVKRAAELAIAYKPATIQKLPAGGWRLVLPDGKAITIAW